MGKDCFFRPNLGSPEGPDSGATPCLAYSAPPPATGDYDPVIITTNEVVELLIDGSGITRQPATDQALVTMDLIAYTDPTPRTLTTTVVNTPVTITATPTTYTWDWGDGTTSTTTDPGAPWPHHTNAHRYRTTATNITITLTTTWSATFTPQGGPTQPINGTITTTSTSTPFDLVRTITYLTDHAEEAQGR